MKYNKIKRHSIRTKFSMVALLIILVSVVTLTLINLKFFSSGMYELSLSIHDVTLKAVKRLMERRGHSLTFFAAESLKDPLYSLDLEKIDLILKSLLKETGVEYAYVIDTEGFTVADGRSGKKLYLLKQKIEDDFYREVANSKQEVIRHNDRNLDVAWPIEIGDQKLGWLRIGFSLDELKAVIANIEENTENLTAAGIKRIFLIITGTFAFLVLLSLLMTKQLAARVTAPVFQLLKGVRAFGAGQMDTTITVTSGDEIESLASEFNFMASRLRESFEKVEFQNRELKEMNRLKTEFLANTSHELRTPMNAILGLVDVLLDGADGMLTDVQIKYLKLIKGNGLRLIKLINDILDLSALHSDKMQIKLSSFSLKHTIDSVVHLSKGLIGDKQLIITTKFDGDIDQVIGDNEKLQHILINLVGNAIKFTPRGEVTIETKGENSHFVIRVADSGIGIARDNLGIIFDEFRQIDGASTRKQGGTGLGLAITKNHIELLGGSISVESELGSGSTFSIRLPREIKEADPSGRDRQKKVENGEFKSESRRKYEEEGLNETGEIDRHSLMKGEGETILIIDDDETNIEVLNARLELSNYAPIGVTSALEGLRMIEKKMPELILLDLMMPDMSGNEFCVTVKKNKAFKNIPIIVVSAKNRVTDRIESFFEGADDYLMKPFDKNELMVRIHAALRLKKLRDELAEANRGLEEKVREKTNDLRHKLDENKLLLQEVHHRVKNNMAIISALLSIQMRDAINAETRSILQDIQNRIRSIADIQEHFYTDQEIKQIDMNAYVKTMVVRLKSIYTNEADIKISVEVEKIYISFTIAIPLGMIINELVSNAFKYAFCEGQPGQLLVNITNLDTNEYILTVKDDGPGLPGDFDMNQPNSVGFEIVRALVKQLGGTLHTESEGGCGVTVKFCNVPS